MPNVQYLAAFSVSVSVMVVDGRPVGLECHVQARTVDELEEIMAGLVERLGAFGFTFDAPAERGEWLTARGFLACEDSEVLRVATEVVTRSRRRRKGDV